MREKLIKLLYETLGAGYTEIVEHTADYLIDNGVMVLPCKVGSTIFGIRTDINEIVESEVTKICFYEYAKPQIHFFIKNDNRYSEACAGEIGKRI